MNKWFAMLAVLLGISGSVRAQEPVALSSTAVTSEGNEKIVPGPNWVMTSLSPFSLRANAYLLAPSLRLPSAEPAAREFAAAKSAMASPAPVPKEHRANRTDNERLQIAFGFTSVRFRSPVINVWLYGLNTSAAYFPRSWLGLEANVTAAFGQHIFNNNLDQTRYAGITGGPKIVWHRGGWEPWVHLLAGAAHVGPQVAAGSRNGLAIQTGGGVDYPVLDGMFSLRMEGDYVRSQLYNLGQNNFQAVVGVAFHF